MNVAPPRVEIGGVGLDVLGVGQAAVRVEDELVGREEEAAEETLDALGARRVVARRQEGAAAAPRALVAHVERKVVRQLRRTVVAWRTHISHSNGHSLDLHRHPHYCYCHRIYCRLG